MKKVLQRITPALLLLSATGCSRNPNVEIIGSYFPGWMIALSIAIVLTVIAHALLRKAHMDHTLGHPVAIYPAMVVLFTCTLWLCLFA
jgi:hypothetical protein